MDGKKEVGVYIHIPFCSHKCPYCDFCSVAVSEAPEKRYVGCLLREFHAAVDGEGPFGGPLELKSIYVGGGTPSILSPSSVKPLIEAVRKTFAGTEPEVTMEANPGGLGPERLSGYLAAGVNRISIGAQSFVEKDLETLGRTHDARTALEAFREARRAGFENIALDLIFGIPGQSLADWETTLHKAMELHPEHVSVYNLTIEEGTPFDTLYGKGKGKGLAEEVELEPGMVFAVEPLIWVPDIPGGAGVRLEDTIVVTKGDPEVLTRTGFDTRMLGK